MSPFIMSSTTRRTHFKRSYNERYGMLFFSVKNRFVIQTKVNVFIASDTMRTRNVDTTDIDGKQFIRFII